MVRTEQKSILHPRMAAQSLEYFRRFRPHRRHLTFLYRDLVAAFPRPEMKLRVADSHRLEYLTQNDWALLIDRATKVTFEKEEMLIKKGKQTKVLYLLVRGTAKIEAEFGFRIAQIGPGQICGEMAFLENGVASATAIAEQEVEACAIDWSALSDLFELYPHLASCFYRSLAVGLSRRLRRQIMSVPNNK
jgi:CRP/FNR family transcriptional regulator, cyclic AMP receptor protein